MKIIAGGKDDMKIQNRTSDQRQDEDSSLPKKE